MNRVIYFEVHAEDPQRAMKFYSNVFGWEFSKWPGPEEYWLVKTGPPEEVGIDGGLMKRRGDIDGNAVIAYVCTAQVVSLEETVSKVLSHGGVNVVPGMPISGVGWLAYCKDTEGNIFGIMQNDPAAKA